jgi:hypothetical protein
MNKECNNHAFGCSGNCKFEVVAFNKNGDCLQFEVKTKEIKKLLFNVSSNDWIVEAINELIDAVNELRQQNNRE